MNEEILLSYEINNTNNSSINITQNTTLPTIYALGPPLATISSVCITIGTLFSIICIYRYIRKPTLRNYFTYIFHCMLIYCLISSFINVPIFLMGYYLSFFEESRRLCQYYATNGLSINIGMVTCLAYASLERNYLIFRKNGILTWRRQILPIFCLMLYSYLVSLLFIFIPQCHYIPCSPCHTAQLRYMIIWIIISFIIPEIVMCSSTIILMIRLYRQKRKLTNKKEEKVFLRIVIQMALYVLWSCLYYCPPTFYNLLLIIDPNRLSPSVQSAMIIINTVSVQSYPVLTFLLMNNYQRIKRNKKQARNDSALKLCVVPTITEQPIS